MAKLKSKLNRILEFQADTELRMLVNNPEAVKFLAADLALNAEKSSDRVRATEIMARTHALLTDRNINDNRNTDITDMVRLAEDAIKSILGQTPDAIGEGQIEQVIDDKAGK